MRWCDLYRNYKKEEKEDGEKEKRYNHSTIEIDYFDKDRKERREIKEGDMIRLEQEDFVDI